MLGSKWKVAVDLIIALAQFSFTVSHISFIIQSIRTTVDAHAGLESPVWPYLLGVLSVLTPIAWVEDIKKFSFTFLVGNLLILSTIVTVSLYCVWLMLEQGGAGPPVPAYSANGFWATVGFAIYSYEGIGIVMPVLSKAREP